MTTHANVKFTCTNEDFQPNFVQYMELSSDGFEQSVIPELIQCCEYQLKQGYDSETINHIFADVIFKFMELREGAIGIGEWYGSGLMPPHDSSYIVDLYNEQLNELECDISYVITMDNAPQNLGAYKARTIVVVRLYDDNADEITEECKKLFGDDTQVIIVKS